MHPGKRFLVLATFLTGWLVSCGAQNTPGPAPLPKPQRCRSMDQLAPALMDSLKGPDSAKLRVVIDRTHLWDAQADGSPSPIVTLLRVTLSTLKAFANDPPEAGAAPGQLCNFDDPPAARDSNRMCEARRILKIFIREGKGEQALHLLDPFIARILSYVVGTGAGTAHYEAAQVVGASCTKAYCRIEDTIDVFVGLLAFLESTFEEPHRAQDVLTLLRDLYAHPGMAALVERAAQINEADLVTTSNMLVENVANLPTDPSAFRRDYLMNLEVKLNDLLKSTSWNSAPYIGLRALLDQVIGPHTPSDTTSPYAKTPLLLDLFDPSRPYPVLQPLQAVIACLNNLNNQEHLDGIAAGVKLVFALGPQSNTGTNSIALADVLGALEGLTEIDDRDSLITFGRRALVMIRDDEEGTTAARKVCAKALDDRAPADGGVPNAELVMPVLQSVFEGGALSELFCLIDTLLYGCASGPQPACPSGSTSP